MKIISADSRKNIRSGAVLAWILFLLIGGIWMVWQNAGSLGESLDFSWKIFAWVVGIKTAACFINALKFRALSQIFRLELSLTEWIGLSVIPTFYAYFAPAQIGHLPRAYYLKKKHQLNYADYLSLVTGLNVFGILITSISGCFFTLPALGNLQGNENRVILICLTAFLIAIAASLAVLGAGRFHLHLPFDRINQFIGNFQKGLALFQGDKKKLYLLMLLQFFSILTTGMGLYFSFEALGFHYPVYLILFTECLVTVMTVVSFTPANLGIREGGIVSIAVLAGVSASHAISASFLSRFGSIAVHFILGTTFSYLLFGTAFSSSGKRSGKNPY